GAGRTARRSGESSGRDGEAFIATLDPGKGRDARGSVDPAGQLECSRAAACDAGTGCDRRSCGSGLSRQVSAHRAGGRRGGRDRFGSQWKGRGTRAITAAGIEGSSGRTREREVRTLVEIISNLKFQI